LAKFADFGQKLRISGVWAEKFPQKFPEAGNFDLQRTRSEAAVCRFSRASHGVACSDDFIDFSLTRQANYRFHLSGQGL
jgi:hypothetical protein